MGIIADINGISTNTIMYTSLNDTVLTATVSCSTQFTVKSVTMTATGDTLPGAAAYAAAITIKFKVSGDDAAPAAGIAYDAYATNTDVPVGTWYYLQFTVPSGTIAGTYTVTVDIDGAAPKTGTLVINDVGDASFVWTS